MIFIGSDHGGFELKTQIYSYIKNDLKKEITDMGNFSSDPIDYPDIAVKVCKKVIENNGIGILLCGTGIGMSIIANKIKGIRCAVCTDEYSTRMTRKHNDSNVLALGGRVTGIGLAKSIVDTFLNTEFEGGKHKVRVDKIINFEKTNNSLT